MRALVFILSLVMTTPGHCEPLNVPPGRDPGGVAIGLLTPTLDLQTPTAQAALARDGEGVAIGWDFSDPEIETPAPSRETSTPQPNVEVHTLRVLGGPGTRVVPAIISSSQPESWARAIAFLAKTPARIIVVHATSSQKTDWTGFAAAAAHFKHLLFVVPAHQERSPDPHALAYSAALNLANVLSISVAPGMLGDARMNDTVGDGSIATALGMVARTLALCAQTFDGPTRVITKAEALATLSSSVQTQGSDLPATEPIVVQPCAAALAR